MLRKWVFGTFTDVIDDKKFKYLAFADKLFMGDYFMVG